MTGTPTVSTRSTARQALLSLLKSAWVLVIFGGVVAYLVTNWPTIREQLSGVALWRVLLAHVCLLGGKLLLVELARHSVEVTGASILYRRMFVINAMSQLAKYLPGGVWHFVGRAGYYHAAGLALPQVTRALIVENLWLVTSACFTGGIAFALYAGDARSLLAVVLFGLWVVLLAVMTRWRVPDVSWRAVFQALGLQALAWSLIGASLWVLIPVNAPGFMLLTVGAFALSWAIGYITLFAPSGLGVREAVLTALLGVVIDPAAALIYAALNRVIWVLTEVLLGVLARLPYFSAS